MRTGERYRKGWRKAQVKDKTSGTRHRWIPPEKVKAAMASVQGLGLPSLYEWLADRIARPPVGSFWQLDAVALYLIVAETQVAWDAGRISPRLKTPWWKVKRPTPPSVGLAFGRILGRPAWYPPAGSQTGPTIIVLRNPEQTMALGHTYWERLSVQALRCGGRDPREVLPGSEKALTAQPWRVRTIGPSRRRGPAQ